MEVRSIQNVRISVHWSPEITERFPHLAICIGVVNGVHVEKENEKIHKLRKAVYEEIRAKHKIETLKDNPTVRAYRDFYWKLHIDPTKTRPSGEALLRRVLHRKELPRISSVVDAYNLASMKTIIPISGFDKDKLNPPFQIRSAEKRENFIGIGMKKPISLTDRMLVLADEKQILCIYPYRDSNQTRITGQTTNVLLVGYGALGIKDKQLKEAVETAVSYVKIVSDGEAETPKGYLNQKKLDHQSF
jgi:DNA/RNA-binding domain of Phe-tRNA-synthetase-like protein